MDDRSLPNPAQGLRIAAIPPRLGKAPDRPGSDLCALLVAAFLLAGCVPYSDKPLTVSDSEGIDSSVVGSWYWREENETGYIHIGRDQKSRLLHVLMVEFHGEDDFRVSEFSGHTSSLEGRRYLNLQWVRPPDEPEGYLIVKYSVGTDRLGIALMDNETVERAIREGSLGGTVDKGGGSSSTRLSENREKLQEFVLRHDRELFPELKYLAKVTLPLTP